MRMWGRRRGCWGKGAGGGGGGGVGAVCEVDAGGGDCGAVREEGAGGAEWYDGRLGAGGGIGSKQGDVIADVAEGKISEGSVVGLAFGLRGWVLTVSVKMSMVMEFGVALESKPASALEIWLSGHF